MNMWDFDVEFITNKSWAHMRPDELNNTSLYLNGRLVWPLELEDGEQPPVLAAKDVVFRLEIPSGTLVGIIDDVVDANKIIEVWKIGIASWAGKFNGLAWGQSGIGRFRYYPRPETVVHSSISNAPLTYDEYIVVRKMFEVACGLCDFGETLWLRPEEIRGLLKSAWRHLQELRKEAQCLAIELNEPVWPIDLEDGEQPLDLAGRGGESRPESPSGTLEGAIDNVIGINDIIEVWQAVNATWNEKFASLAQQRNVPTSLLSLARPGAVVDSNIVVRKMVEVAARGGFDKPVWFGLPEIQELMRSAWRHLQELHKEVKKIAARF